MARDDENFDHPEGAEEQDFEFSVGDESDSMIESNDFEIGDSPYGDTDDNSDEMDILGEIEDMEAFELGDGDDALHGETIAHSESDHLDHSESDIYDDPDNNHGEHSDSSSDEDWEDEEEADEEPEKSGLSWKAWAGLIGVAVIVAGGAVTLTLPSSPAPSQPVAQQVQRPTVVSQQAAPEATRPAKVQAQAINLNMGQAQPEAAPAIQAPVAQPVIPDTYSANPVRDITATEEVLAENFATKEDFSGLKSLVGDQGTQLDGLTKAINRTESTLTKIDARLVAIEKRLETEPTKVSKSDPDKKRQPDESVKEAQVILAAYNYNPGAIDGLMGRRTAAAIKRFQKVHDLSVNGELNKETLKTISSGDVKRFAGKSRNSTTTKTQAKTQSPTWYVRGVTPDRAIVYRGNGSSYMVSLGTEVPGMGQVTGFDPANNTVTTVGGKIRTQ